MKDAAVIPKKQEPKVKLSYFRDGTDRWLKAAYITGNLLSGIIIPTFVYLFAQFAIALAGGSSLKWQVWCFLMVLAAVFDFFFVAIGTGCAELTAERQLRKVRSQFLREVMRQDIEYYDSFDATTLASQLNANCASFRDARGMRSGLMFMYIGLTIGCLGFSFWQGPVMAAVCLCTLPIMIGAGWWATRIEVQASAATQKSFEEAASVAQESLSAIRTVKAFGLEENMKKRFNEAVNLAFTTATTGANKSAFGYGLYWGLIFASSAFGFWYGATLVSKSLDRTDIDCSFGSQNKGCFDGAMATAIFINIILAAYFVGKILPMLTLRLKALRAVTEIVALISRPINMDPYASDGIEATTVAGTIEFKDVSFSYPTRPDMQVFNNLNLTIENGQSIALVGGSGCGKSTIVQLIERFYDPTNGAIYLDGTPIKEYNLCGLRGCMALVSQEPKLFASTIAANIQVGRESATRDEIIAAAKEANAHEFICQLPDGYDTWVGEGGGQLSGGQKQRIAISRAILRNPRILILDEATSALDNQSEKIVQETLDRVVSGRKRTTIIIAHRLTTVRNADKIIVLDNSGGNGSVVAEEGTHEELLQIENGLYAALVHSQTSGDVDDEMERSESLRLALQYSRDFSTRQRSLISLHSKFSVLPEDGQMTLSKATEPSRTTTRLFRRTMMPLRNQKLLVFTGCLGSLIYGGVWPIFAIAFSYFEQAYGQQTGQATMDIALPWTGGVVAIGIGAFAGFWLQTALMARCGEINVRKLRVDAYKRLLEQETGFFDFPENGTGSLVHILSTDVSLLRGWTGDNIGILFGGASCLLIGVVAALSASWKLGLVALAGLSVMIPVSYIAGVVTATGGKLKKTVSAAEAVDQQRPAHILNEVVLNIRTVYAYNLQEQMNAKFDELVEQEYQRGKRRSWAAGLTNGGANCIRLLIFTGVFYYGGILTVNGEISPRAMIQGSLCILLAAMQLGRTFMSSTSTGQSREAAANVFSLIDRKALIDETGVEGAELKNIDGINFDQVAFRYPTRPNVPVYQSVSFTIPKGKVVALVGASGCGKSTAVQLLERFYDLSDDALSGSVAINGRDVREYSVRSLRERIGLVSQEPCLFWGSVEENVAFGNPRASLDELEKACRMANAWDFIQTLPNGLQTDVGRGGSMLSGGQKQRVAIARALIRNPELLILDEATSALDNESERIVQEALSVLLEDKAYTTVIIAHRLSTIRKADSIVVFVNNSMRGSKIAEVGTHDQLMRIPKGIYRGLVRIADAK